MIKPPKYALFVLTGLLEAGFAAYFVGGCVRDRLLSRRPNDYDVATSATPDEIVASFARTVPTGATHGTVTVLAVGGSVEVTTFRADGAYTDHRRPDSVSFTGDLERDLARRDFTINAMAMDVAGGVIDPFGGCDDLAARLVRCVGDPATRFSEDALRMLRAVRFAAQLGFAVEERTRSAIAECAPLCASLSPERVRDELLKTLYSPEPERLRELVEFGLLDAFLARRGGAEAGLSRLPRRSRLARWCLSLERSESVDSTERFLRSLRLDKKTITATSDAVAVLKSGSRDWKRLVRDHGREAALTAYPNSRALRRTLSSGECMSLAELAVNGDDLAELGIRGRDVGRALARLLDHVIDSPEDNDRMLLMNMLFKERDK